MCTRVAVLKEPPGETAPREAVVVVGGGVVCANTTEGQSLVAPHNNTHAGTKSLKKSEVRITALAVPDCRAHYRRCAQSHYTAVHSQSLQNTAVWPRSAALARRAARYIEP